MLNVNMNGIYDVVHRVYPHIPVYDIKVVCERLCCTMIDSVLEGQTVTFRQSFKFNRVVKKQRTFIIKDRKHSKDARYMIHFEVMPALRKRFDSLPVIDIWHYIDTCIGLKHDYVKLLSTLQIGKKEKEYIMDSYECVLVSLNAFLKENNLGFMDPIKIISHGSVFYDRFIKNKSFDGFNNDIPLVSVNFLGLL
jgi:hypothetical protein